MTRWAGALLLLGCSSSSTPTPGAGDAAAPAPLTPAQRTQAQQSLVDAGLPVVVPAMRTDYAENEFTESDHARDPFRSFASMFVEDKSKRPVGAQVAVLLGQYSIDELKLVAIQTGGDYARAQLVDPTTKGWTVKKGDYIGRPDVVHVGGSNGADYQLNWRIDRIRDGDIVLTREDPAQPMVPPATRVIPLHPEAETQTTM